MPLFQCETCGVVENTATSNYWWSKRKGNPLECSQCDPAIGKWHGHFPRDSAEGMGVCEQGFLFYMRDGDFCADYPNVKIVRIAGAEAIKRKVKPSVNVGTIGHADHGDRKIGFSDIVTVLSTFDSKPLISARPINKPKARKVCLQCGNEHTHNNAFCSAECCKEYKNGNTPS